MHRLTLALILIAPLLACPGGGGGTDATASTGGADTTATTAATADAPSTGGTSAPATSAPETSSPTTGEPETTAVMTLTTTGSTDPSDTTTDDTADPPACEGSLPRLELSLLAGSECAMGVPEEAVVEGTFLAMPDGFVVVGEGGDVNIGPEQPAIPDGTLVRMTYGCTPGFYGDAGAFVRIDNLESLEGVPNPTEAGARAWFFMTAGGEAYSYVKSPFEVSQKTFCGASVPLESYTVQLRLIVAGPGFMVDVPPGESAAFTADDGPHAGGYSFENVNFTDIGFEGGDTTENINMRLVRAD